MSSSLRLLGALVCACVAAGCGRTPSPVFEPVDAGDDAAADAAAPTVYRADKLDLLLVIDNSRTAAVAHPTLSRTVPYLLDRLNSPRCVNGLGQIVADTPPLGAPCAVGVRDFAPVTDLHVGVISSSLGGHGADSCSPAVGSYTPEQNDGARLLVRGPGGAVVPSYAGLGFLAWDPEQRYDPPGDDDLGAIGAKLGQMVSGVGGAGCGFEAPLEAFYRFLIDPDPYESITVVQGLAELQGTDTTLLAQRAAFLRPDSALLIVVLSDEDDCSTREGGQFYLSNQAQLGDQPYHLPRARSACAADPEDPCCASCGQPTPTGCPADSVCDGPPLSAEEDPLNLRCFDQQRRFGIDFLYPLERYVEGLTAPEVADRTGQVHHNPLFGGGRTPRLVVLAAITGVPWQDIAFAPENVAGGYQAGKEIDWTLLLPDATTGAPPADPLMLGSRAPRSGNNPVEGSALAPPSAPSPSANPINGHEHLLGEDLQYACIYRLDEPVDCAHAPCECAGPSMDTNPVCQNDAGQYQHVQYFGRATPATRVLRLMQTLGPAGVVASICAVPSATTGAPGFGYKPAVNAIMRALHPRLVPADAPAAQ